MTKADVDSMANIEQSFFDEIREMAEASFNGLKNGDTESKKKAAITSLILASKIKVSDKLPTAAAYFEMKKGVPRPVIIVNVIFYNTMKSWGKGFGLLCHELFHLIFEHFPRFAHIKNQSELQLLNIALDCAINQLIAEFESFDPSKDEYKALTPEKFNCVNYHTFCLMFDLKKANVKQFGTAEYYFDLAKKNQNKLPKPKDGEGEGEGEGELQEGQDPFGQGENHDAHRELNKDLTPSDIETIKDYVRKHMTLHGCKPSDFGIENLKIGFIKWKAIIKNFVSRSIKTDVRKTRTRPNRRHGWLTSKKVFDRKPELVFLADSSGSMVVDFPLMANEVFSLCKAVNIQSIDLYYIDTQLHDKGVYKVGQSFPPIKGGGGTAFTTGLNELSKKLKTGQSVIFFTDTFSDCWPERKPNFPMLIIASESPYDGANIPEWVRRSTIDMSGVIEAARKNAA